MNPGHEFHLKVRCRKRKMTKNDMIFKRLFAKNGEGSFILSLYLEICLLMEINYPPPSSCFDKNLFIKRV
jgi:hypothetical protein